MGVPLDWLLIGAMAVETTPVIRRLTRRQLVAPRLIAGSYAGRQVAVATVGVGPRRALERSLAALERYAPAVVVSFGTCGGLTAATPRGALVTASGVQQDTGKPQPLPVIPGFNSGIVATVSKAVWGTERRDRLARSGAAIVEMELAAVTTATRTRRPDAVVAALKVVSDMAGGDPLDPVGATRPSPVHIARFKARALSLVEGTLAPALLQALAQHADDLAG